jgi:peptide/nickel transport system ATP-binding protein/oligopeptide transport system ATP-binding protein
VLSVRDLTVEFVTSRGTLRAVNGVSFDLAPGEILAIVGESGCGKTVTGLTVAGLSRGDDVVIGGHVWFESRDLVALPDEELRRMRGSRLAMIFQDPLSSLNPVRTVGSQIAESVRYHGNSGRREALGRAAELLAEVGIPNAGRAVDAYPHEFSGGMRQRAMIALALAAHPTVLVADEPTTALDVTIQAQILALIERIAREQQLAVVLISHDLAVVQSTADRALVMYAGRVLESGPAAELFEHPMHPYTWALTQAVPRTTGPKLDRLKAIGGAPPSLLERTPGCPFQPRCALVLPDCATLPPLRIAGGSDARTFLCWHEEPDRLLGTPPATAVTSPAERTGA